MSFLPSVCLPVAAKCARGAFEIGRQVGDAGLDHRIDDALRREEGKSERRVIPHRGVEARVPRGEGRAALEGGAEIGRRVVPIEDRAVGVPGLRGSVADGERAYDRARRRGICVGSDGLEIGPPGRESRSRTKVRSSEANIGVLSDAPATRLLGGRRRRPAVAAPGAGAGPCNDIQSMMVRSGIHTLPYWPCG